MGASIIIPLGQSTDAEYDPRTRIGPFIEHLQSGIVIISDPTGNVIEANSSALHLLDYSRVDLIGKFIWEIRPFKIIIPSEKDFEELRNQAPLRIKKLTFETRGGDLKNVEVFLDPYKDGNSSSIVCQLHEITEVSRPEEAGQQHKDDKDIQIQDQKKELDSLNKQIGAENVERQRWAQQLHDAINQSLFSAGLIAEVLPRLWERDQPAARRSLEDLRRLIFGAMAEMRILLAESRSSILAESDLSDLLVLLGNAAAGRLNIPVAVEPKGKSNLPGEAQIGIYHLCKELLNVITRRAKAKRIKIEIIGEPSETVVRIYENGDTFEAPLSDSTGYKDFREAIRKAELCGANLEIKTPRDGVGIVSIQWKKSLS
jgi:PAS domain S-box-containing protein